MNEVESRKATALRTILSRLSLACSAQSVAIVIKGFT
jgi:hypothetical protein